MNTSWTHMLAELSSMLLNASSDYILSDCKQSPSTDEHQMKAHSSSLERAIKPHSWVDNYTQLNIILYSLSSHTFDITSSFWTMFHRFATRGFSNAARSIAAKQRTRFVVNHVAKPAVAAVLSSSSSLSSPRHFSTDPSKTNTNPDMMCRQCEQTKDHFACTTVGVCGKTAETSVSTFLSARIIWSLLL